MDKADDRTSAAPPTSLAEARKDAATRPLASINLNNPVLWQAGLIAPYLDRLRHDAPVHYCGDDPGGPFWSITRYDDILAIEADPNRFSSDAAWGGITIDGMAGNALPMFIAMDPPRHEAQRRALAPAFSPSRLKAMEPLIRDRAGVILDALPIGEPFDWVDRAATELSAMTLATLFEFPQDQRRMLAHWSAVATAIPGSIAITVEDWNREMRACLASFDALWLERAESAPGHDLIGMLAHTAATRDMPPRELLGNLMLLIVGGQDTTRSSLTSSVLALDRNPAEHAKLRADPTLLPAMITETIRWQSPQAHMRRTATMDVEFKGQRIAKGDKVVLWYASANRDESVFADGHAFVIDRTRGRPHIAFGHGIHRCLASRFAEMSLHIIWQEMLRRFAVISVIGEPTRNRSTFISGFDRMMVLIPARR